jgi:hypothetical protein
VNFDGDDDFNFKGNLLNLLVRSYNDVLRIIAYNIDYLAKYVYASILCIMIKNSL